MIAPYPPVNGREPCRRRDPEDFHPRAGMLTRVNREAVADCHRCHVREQCLAYALTHNVSGIWGGTTDAERREVRGDQSIVPVQLDAHWVDRQLICYSYERGVPLADIADLAFVPLRTVRSVIRQYQRLQRRQQQQQATS